MTTFYKTLALYFGINPSHLIDLPSALLTCLFSLKDPVTNQPIVSNHAMLQALGVMADGIIFTAAWGILPLLIIERAVRAYRMWCLRS